MKKIVLIGIMGLMGLTGAKAQDTVRMTLDSCLRYAHRHNLQVQASVLNRESSETTLRGAKLRFLPTVSASASGGMSWSESTTHNSSYGVNGSLTLFDGLSNLRNYQQSKVSAEQSALKVQQTENSIDVQIISAYLTILMNREKLSYQQEVVNTSRQQKEEGELKYRVGRILESDYMLLDANSTVSEVEMSNTKLTIMDNMLALGTMLCIDDRVVFDVVEPEDSLKAADCTIISRDSMLAQARRTMPDWQISEMDVSIARYNVGLAQGAFMPTVSLNAGTSYNKGTLVSDNPVSTMNGGLNTSLTLGISLPILNRGTSMTQLKQSKIALQQAELQNQQTQIDLEDKLDEMYINLRLALNRFRSTEALMAAYKASYEVYVVKYAEGAVTTVEMLQQQERYLSALNDYLQSKYSYLLAEKQLDIYTGKEIKL